ncbi:DEAD/DEAH box helicase [Methanocella arvoryzae]|uniref:DNA/RNA helicase (SNF2 family) n=1 Tax=Methanocella arvoryzae (strain DSM 22066 / NBRC 105507 / MRE50) TaxID=351160 RepID=Q0W926_METAR|nr:DEAD/DEAH box helicase [Methanocella arvoryzae]CAJ35100.1 putative DNA/RNA helicase (SNF2 family) [Methanocella arvoryzae MRE50]
MITLHGTWTTVDPLNGTFFLWGESDPATQHKRRGRPRKSAGEKQHPFHAGIKELEAGAGAINSSCIRHIADAGARAEQVLILPSATDRPLRSASPSALESGEETNPDSSLQFLPWTVTGINIKPGNALVLLSSIAESQKRIGDMAIGPDLLYWSKVAKFTLKLLISQQFRPEVVEVMSGKAYSRWRFALTDETDRKHYASLENSMPLACIAVSGKAGIYNRKEALDLFINTALDTFIRDQIALPADSRMTNLLSQAWLDSLGTGESIRLSAPEMKKLKDSAGRWTSRMKTESKQALKTCFILEPPAPDTEYPEAPWNLRYCLQASDDPSLVIPAETVWKELKKTLKYLNKRYDNPQEQLLQDLGKAMQMFPEIEPSLNTSKPLSATLSTSEAYKFLTEAAPLLQDSGYSIILPEWWRNSTGRLKLGARLRFKPKAEGKAGKSQFTMDTLVSYDWRLALGDQEITETEFRKLAALKEPLLQIGGKWFALKKEDIDSIMKAFRAKKTGEMALSEALRLNGGLEDFNGIPVSGMKSSGWLAELFDRLAAGEKITSLAPPDGFNGELRDYQVKGYSWLAFMKKYGLGSILADDMGLGKTIQLLALLLKEKERGTKGPTLLICPTSILGNWQREAKKFAPALKVHIHHGAGRADKEQFGKIVKAHDLILSTYAHAYRDEELLKEVNWKLVVLDEAQNIKNHHTRQARAIRALKADHRIAMTGTPIENRLSELWSIVDFLNPGYLGKAETFRKQFAIPIERYDDAARSEKLKQAIKPLVLRRVKTDPAIIKDLPDKIEIKEPCNLTKEQATLYEAIVENMLKSIDKATAMQRRGIVLASLMKLKQVCDHPSLYIKTGAVTDDKTLIRSGKLKRLTELLEEALAEGDSVLIFTQFVEMGEMLKAYLQSTFDEEALFLHGGVPQKARDKMVLRFGEKDGPRIFIVSLKAGGVGLNLTKASHVFHFDRWWNPAVENQATDRAYRIGQSKNVLVHKFVCAGTLEEKIDELIESKKALSANILGTGEDWITELSTEQLRDMVMLRWDEVADDG